jgi:hypothetical protein
MHPLSTALGSIPLYQSSPNVEIARALDRQPKVVCQTEPHKLAALIEDWTQLCGSWISAMGWSGRIGTCDPCVPNVVNIF